MKGLIGSLVVIAAACSGAVAQPFQLAAAELPPFSGSAQPVHRFSFPGSFGAASPLSDIDASYTNDPAGVAFRNPADLFVGNRFGHSGEGSISRFTIDSSLGYTPGPTITGNGLSDVHGIAFNSVDGELFAANNTNGLISRFLFDGAGNPVPNGTVSTGFGLQAGVGVRGANQDLFVTDYSGVARFARDGGGGYSQVGYTSFGSGSAHFISFLNDDMYIADLYTGVNRFGFDGAGEPYLKEVIPSDTPLDVAFSPDGQEMFVGSHITGGITRFAFDAGSDTWQPTGDFIATSSIGGLDIAAIPAPGAAGVLAIGLAARRRRR